MESENSQGEKQLGLAALIFSAKIDYFTVYTGSKQKLPLVRGTPRWVASKGCSELSVHDPVASDVIALTQEFGALPLTELEVCVDIGCAPSVPGPEQLETLEKVMVDLLARTLYPRNGPLMERAARTFYRRLPDGYNVRPFNLSLPRATDQQLHGFRGDWVQVKAYLKRTDSGRELAQADYVARVEVRLKGGGLHEHGIHCLHDLIGFKFRKRLSSYFRFVEGARLRALDRKAVNAQHRVLTEWLQRRTDIEWGRTGVGSIEQGGKVAHRDHRLLRDSALNNRIGQALHRLEKSFRTEKFVRVAGDEKAQNVATEPVRGCLAQSPMTI